ncbi:MAG: sugar phosphate isomerase/epimerase [Pseudomonadota bacterium]
MTVPLSVQLYTLRALRNLDRILQVAASAGYQYVETLGAHLDDPVKTAAKLQAHGLRPSSSHVGLDALRAKPDALIDACHQLGIEQLFMPAVPPEQRDMDADGWRALGDELGAVAARFQAQGISLGYHNHDWELAPKDGERSALELLFEAAGDRPLAWQADVAWLVRGGAEPKAWLDRYRDRLISAHVKDIAPAGQNLDEDGWTDVGAGVLDWPDLWHACLDAGAQTMVVEHDQPSDPVRTARASFDFLRSLAA